MRGSAIPASIPRTMVRTCGRLSSSSRTVGDCVLTRASADAPRGGGPNFERARRLFRYDVRVGELAEAGDRAPQDARDLHLRDADPLGDLSLGEVVREAQREHAPLTLAQLLGGGAHGQARLDAVETRIGCADRVDD